MLLTGVFTSNPNGDRLKRLDGHENEKPWNAGLLFYFSKRGFQIVFLFDFSKSGF